jgi:hypothetical protein
VIGGRFGRRRRTEDGRGAPIDASWLERATTALAAGEVRRLEWDDVPPSFALLGLASGEGERRTLVAVSARSGGDALFAALAAELRPEAAGAEVVAAAPRFDGASRRRLGALRGPLRTLELGGAETVLPELPTPLVPEECLSAPLASPADRSLFARAMAGLRGLAAKHGGATRAARGGLELVILARPVASLRADPARVSLDILAPDRLTLTLDDAGLVEALDRLEGGIRRRLADRHVRDGEDGLRGRLVGQLAQAAGLRFALRWPFAGPAQDVDVVGVDAEGALVLGFVRDRLGLPELGAVLDAALAAEPLLPLAVREAPGPVQITERPRLVLAAREIDAAAEAVIGRLTLATLRLRTAGDSLVVQGETERAPVPERIGRFEFTPPPAGHTPERAPEREPFRSDGEGERERDAGPGRGRRRRRRGRGRRGGRDDGPAYGGAEPRDGERADEGNEPPERESFDTFSLGADDDEPAPAATAADLDERGERDADTSAEGSAALEFSAFELGDEPASGDAGLGQPRRGRRRGRGRRRRRGPGDAGESADEDEPPRREPQAEAPAAEAESLDDDVEAELELSPDAPDPEEAVVPAYEEEEEGEPESELDRLRLEREQRRRARGNTLSEPPGGEGGGELGANGGELQAPRGRAAILAHADRDSIAAAVLLARDMRQLEGIWIYPQADLMTFFRGVATDLRESTPIYVVGFVPRPSRDVLQAAALYRGRLVWFDHHEWPPEDLLAMRDALGAGLVRVLPGAGSSLPAIVPFCQRRSRFTDKLVDLACGRFTVHDFQRWGRLWSWRIGELVKKRGEHRADLELLIEGRPSDLAREAERAAMPPPPEELAWVASRDFRLVHFGGLGLAVVEVPPELDLGLTMRLVRERYAVPLSLGRKLGQEAIVLGTDDATTRRALDLGAMVQHLGEKFEWADALPDDDHVARLRVRGVEARPERLEELVAEIGMSRALLEG